MGKMLCLLSASILIASWTMAWTTGWIVAQQAPTAPANEPRAPVTVRSPHSLDADLTVPLCPAQFHDSLARNGVAGPQDQGVMPAKVKTSVPAPITQQAIEAAGKTHIGNYLVIVNVMVDTKGNPQDVCLEKSSGYGLDARAATAVREYRFQPAMKDGKPVKMRIPVEVRFVPPVVALVRPMHETSSILFIVGPTRHP
jgi:TonB family protein